MSSRPQLDNQQLILKTDCLCGKHITAHEKVYVCDCGRRLMLDWNGAGPPYEWRTASKIDCDAQAAYRAKFGQQS